MRVKVIVNRYLEVIFALLEFKVYETESALVSVMVNEINERDDK